MYGKGTADTRRDGNAKLRIHPSKQITRGSAKARKCHPQELGVVRGLRHGETVKANCNPMFKAMNYATEKSGCLFIELVGATPVPNIGGSAYAMITIGICLRFKVFLKNETTSALRSFVIDCIIPQEAQDWRNSHRQWWGVPWSVPEQTGRAQHQARVHSARHSPIQRRRGEGTRTPAREVNCPATSPPVQRKTTGGSPQVACGVRSVSVATANEGDVTSFDKWHGTSSVPWAICSRLGRTAACVCLSTSTKWYHTGRSA